MKKDLNDYINTMTKQRLDMQKAVDEATELLKSGSMSAESAQSISNAMRIIETNYQRVMYCKHLIDQPPKFIQKLIAKRNARITKAYKEMMADKESVEKENEEALVKINDEVNKDVE